MLPAITCRCYIPALFAHGENDDFIKPDHSRKLHEAYAGEKELIIFHGDHNSPRPERYTESVTRFLRRALMVKPEHCVDMYAGGIPQTLGFDQMNAGQAAVQQREAEMMRRALALSMQPAAGRDGDPGGRLVVARNPDDSSGGSPIGGTEEDEMMQHALLMSMGDGGQPRVPQQKTEGDRREQLIRMRQRQREADAAQASATAAAGTAADVGSFTPALDGPPAAATVVQVVKEPRPPPRERPAKRRLARATLDDAAASFEAVVGIGGATAQYHTYIALSRGLTVEGAIASYFDSGNALAPAGWTLPE